MPNSISRRTLIELGLAGASAAIAGTALAEPGRLPEPQDSPSLPDSEKIGGSLDYFQWTAILRAVSALTAYHWVYKESLKPWLVADLLILNNEMPRSLAACYDNIARYLDQIAHVYGRQGASQRQARLTRSRLQILSMDDLFQSGLHDFVTGFLAENNRLGTAIAEQYLV